VATFQRLHLGFLIDAQHDRPLGLKGTEWAHAQVGTIRLRLLKIGAQVRITTRRVRISLASGFPWREMFGRVWANLRC
jgi:hypothetical protein